MRFGRLTVVSFSGLSGNAPTAYWTCICQCGSMRNIIGTSLSSGKSKSCGCLSRERSSLGCDPYEAIYRNLKRGAVNRGHEVTLTFPQYLSFIGLPCHYCEYDLIWHERIASKYGRNANHNLDRKDNSIGYSLDNCVPCCWICNEMKSSHISYEEMLVIGRARKDFRLNKLII